MEIRFYHLTTTTLDRALPQLLKLTLSRGHRAIVRATTNERLSALDTLLWTYNDREFLPHAVDGSEHDAHQPILLTTSSEPSANQATFAFWIDGFGPQAWHDNGAKLSGDWVLDDDVQRLCVLFSGHDPVQLGRARQYYRLALDTEGVEQSYWRQTDAGQWDKMA